tara:strand:+ start:28692 stop:29186 length:495 start_codon:yes stop_codon:yes gene_type:complete
MKKNLLLYILLLFLIIVNGFFLYNYLGNNEKEGFKEPIRPDEFLLKELKFDGAQQELFNELGKKHHHTMRGLSDGIKVLKDNLFKGLSDSSLSSINIDSIATLIGEKTKARDLEALRHFKSIQELCNDKQKEKFNKIISDALRKGARNQGPPRRERLEGNRPPR